MVSADAPSKTEIIRYLERMIVEGQFPPGSLLPSERSLAEILTVSRSTVREALRVLDERRLVVISHGRGVFVREPDSVAASAAFADALRRRNVTARDVIVARRTVERETAATAATARTDRDLAILTDALDTLDSTHEAPAKAQADLAFHRAIARASHNAVLETIFDAISDLTSVIMLRSLTDRSVAAAGLPHHEQLVEAIAAREPDLARTLVDRHLDVAIHRYGADLDEPVDTVARRQWERLNLDRGTSALLDKIVASP